MSEEVDPKKHKLVIDSVDVGSNLTMQDTIMQKLIKHQTGESSKKPLRLSFVDDPYKTAQNSGIFKPKVDLLPDSVIKQVRVQNLLVASILRARGNVMSMIGHIRKDRFDVGLEVNIKDQFVDHIDPEQMVIIRDRIEKFKTKLINCGETENLPESEKLNLASFMGMQTENLLSFGRMATDIVYDDYDKSKVNRFRPTDVATIFRAYRKDASAEGIRQAAIQMIENELHEKFPEDQLPENDTAWTEYFNKKKENKTDYEWIQVIQGYPRQVFTDKELLVFNMFPTTDIEHHGYPITPLDNAVTSIITYQSIELYNKLYFQNGRAAKGMLVIQDDNLDPADLAAIKQDFQASINDVTKSFRAPLLGLDTNTKVEWIALSQEKKDGEFQFLFDQVIRNIMAVFSISPEEIPGFTHLSKGTNSQSLSESSSEYKLTAARDTGLRPLILKWETFFNENLFPLLDPELAQLCVIELSGLDAEDKQQETARLQQDMPIHYDYDSLMHEVDKDPIGAHLGGKVPFNEYFRRVTDSYIYNNVVTGELLESPASMVDPLLNYIKDPFFFDYLQLCAQYNEPAVRAFFATRKDKIDTLKMLLQDWLDENE